ncbi:Uncharacterized protein Rs2_01583 [Raphanus sativus]|nr:Uncharacterized protein Rs2_01583 [Raphanus sativus]
MHVFLWWWSAFGFPGNCGFSTVLRQRMTLGSCRLFVGRGRRLSILEEGFELFTKVGSGGRESSPGGSGGYVPSCSTASTSIGEKVDDSRFRRGIGSYPGGNDRQPWR